MRENVPKRGRQSRGAVRRWTDIGPAHSLYAPLEETDAG